MLDLLFSQCGTDDPLALLLAGGHVRRYHTRGRTVDQDVGQHTWRGLVILLYLWPNISREAIVAFLYHDAAEVFTGDSPAPVKRAANGAFKDMDNWFHAHTGVPHTDNLSNEDKARVKIADCLELAITCSNPLSTDARRMQLNGIGYIGNLLPILPPDEAKRVVNLITEIKGGKYVEV